MKAHNKVQSQFTSKLSGILSKFKDSSTIHVGHDQLKTFFNEYQLKDIIVPFISKMDTSDQLSDREKKQYTKVYISLVECFREEILFDQFFEKIMESLKKKSFGVSQVISHICKTLLNRIQDPQNLYPYVNIILHIFRNHSEIAKIIKQLIEIIDSSVIGVLQEDIMTTLHDKINNAKIKNDFLDAILALVLNLEEKINVLPQIHNFLMKYLKSEDWNCRKICVDIGNALLIINHEIAPSIHNLVKELKYDKIKHVRQSVNNYEALYKQTYGEETPQKPVKQYTTFKENKQKAEQDKRITKSPAPIPTKIVVQEKQRSTSSLEKAGKLMLKNDNFFKNAKNSDVIKITEQNPSCINFEEKSAMKVAQNISMVELPEIKKTLQLVNEKANNFEAYLKNRNSPKEPLSSSKNTAEKREVYSGSSKGSERSGLKFNYESELQNFRKKNRPLQPESYKSDPFQEQNSISQQSYQQPSSSCFLMNESNHQSTIESMFQQFSKKVFQRLDRIEERMSNLQRQRVPESQSSRMFKARVVPQQQSENMKVVSPKSIYYNQTLHESAWDSSISQGVESNIEDKVRNSIINQNWDEAFTLALTNNKKTILLNLLERCVFPLDKTVEQCILLEIKKLLGFTSALKWLKYYLTEKTLSMGRLLKLKEQIEKRSEGDSKNYQLMRQLVINEINQIIDHSK